MRARRTHAERQRDAEARLTQALAELIAEQGYDRTTVAEIGERAGYSRAAVHDRYGGKDELLLALHGRYQQALLGDAEDGSEVDAMEFFARVIEMHRTQPVWLRAMCILTFESVVGNHAYTPILRGWMDTLDASIAQLLRTAQATGQIRPDVDVEQYAPRLVETMFGGAFRWTLYGDELGEGIVVQRVGEVFAELAPHAAA